MMSKLAAMRSDAWLVIGLGNVGFRVGQELLRLGDAVVATRDASGLFNEAAWIALERKGLIKSHYPDSALLTRAGQDYETGLADAIIHHADH